MTACPTGHHRSERGSLHPHGDVGPDAAPSTPRCSTRWPMRPTTRALRMGHRHDLGAGPARSGHRRAGHRLRRRHARRRVRRRRLQQLADHRLRDRPRRAGQRRRARHVDLRRDDLHGDHARQRPGQRRARARAGAQRRSGSPTPSRRPGRSGPTSSRRRRRACARCRSTVGSASNGRPSTPGRAARWSPTWSRSPASRARWMRAPRARRPCAPPIPGDRERQPGAVHRQRAQPGVPGARRMDRGRRHRHAVRPAHRGRHHRHRRRRRRHGHRVVVAVQRQRRRDRRLLRPAARRRADRSPVRTAGVLGHDPRPGRRSSPPRAAAPSPRWSQVGPDAASVQFSGTVTDRPVLLRRLGLQPRRLREHRGRGHRSAPGSRRRDRRAERHGWMNEETWDRYIAGVDIGGPAPADRRGRRATAPRSASRPEFRGTGWLADPLQPSRSARRPGSRCAAARYGAAAARGRQVMPSNATPVAHVRAAERGCGTSRRRPGRGRRRRTTRDCPPRFRCGVEGNGDGRVAQSATTCQIPDAKPGDRVWLDVEVAGVTARYWNR